MNRDWLLPALARGDGPAHIGTTETEV